VTESKQAEPISTGERNSSILFRLWVLAVFTALLIFSIICAAWAVRHVTMEGGKRFSDAQTEFVLALSNLPHTVFYALSAVRDLSFGDPPRLLISRESVEKPHWVRLFPAAEDSGYLLFAGVDQTFKFSTVKLIRLSDGVVLARWNPDWPAIYQGITAKRFFAIGSPHSAQARHPLLLDDGDIIFNTFSSLVRLGPCSSKPVWVLDEAMHHSIELDTAGTGVWVPSNSSEGLADNPWLRDRVQDDALAHVSLDGRLLEKLSFSRILRENGLEAMLLGRFGFRQNEEPVHMNQISVAHYDTKFWKKGDLLISARHLSAVLLYRPSTRKIIWHKTGPWLNQHAARFVGDRQISVFDNAVIGGVPDDFAFMPMGGINRVIVYDFSTDETSQPFVELLNLSRPVTITEGLARLLPDGGLFVEETNQGRTMRFTRDKLLWSHINDYDDSRIGTVHWSRYMTAEEAAVPLRALSNRTCRADQASK
jgi:Arylsulfotransferase (ASST)